MATRFYLGNSSTAFPAPTGVVPAFAAWGLTTGAVRRMMVPFTSTDALTTNSLGQTSGSSQLYFQFISDPMPDGLAFTTSTTFGCQIQGLESAANDNIINRVRAVKVVSLDGGTIRSTLIALGNATSVVEWNTSLRNLTFLSATASASNYTTVDGDRLVLEIGANDSSGATITGSLRIGADAAGTGDLAVNETDTTTTLRPWFESSLNLTFKKSRAESVYLQTVRPRATR